MFTAAKSAIPARGSVLLLAAACFAAGLTVSAIFGPAGPNAGPAPTYAPPPPAPLRGGLPAEVLRVLDGDTVPDTLAESDLLEVYRRLVLLRTFDELGYRQEQRFHFELGLLKLVHGQSGGAYSRETAAALASLRAAIARLAVGDAQHGAAQVLADGLAEERDARDAVHVGLHHDRDDRLLRRPARA